MIKPQKPYKDDKGALYGGPRLTGVAVGSGLALSAVTALVSIFFVDTFFPTADPQWRADQLFGIEAFIGALVAITGTLLRALSHNYGPKKNMDYLGKLFAVGTLGFVLLAAQAKLAPVIHSEVAAWTCGILGVVLAFLARLKIVRPEV
ncbi:hypothetical protein ACIPC2_14285 [Curtobacterium pusillum]|uniref:hypothetical protein n=1 Tax=Curtobacterium pusillum TaxID=69373 RepID=UPI0037F28F06